MENRIVFGHVRDGQEHYLCKGNVAAQKPAVIELQRQYEVQFSHNGQQDSNYKAIMHHEISMVLRIVKVNNATCCGQLEADLV